MATRSHRSDRRPRRTTGALGGLCAFAGAVLVLASGCEKTHEIADIGVLPGEPRTIVLGTIDTWRRDATGFLGEARPSPTPFLDDLAKQGLIATDAMAPVPLTGPSHWSILTGRWPWRDDMRTNGDAPRDVSEPTLPEILRSRGWRTAAFVSCAVLMQRFGFGSGFEHYDDDFYAGGGLADVDLPERRGDVTVDSALEWIGERKTDERIFLWVHLFDPHFPYDPPVGPLPGEHGAYRAEVAFADAQLERLAAGLEALGRPLDESLWVVLSDHGEGLGEHGEDSHGLILHGATTRIPFLVAGASVPVSRFEGLSSTVDVVPTILGVLGLEAPASDGADLLKASASRERQIPLESLMGARAFGLAPAWGLRFERWLWESSPADHLWNLEADPAEESDLAAALPDRVERMRSLRRRVGMQVTEASRPPDHETAAMLRALGYASGGSSAGEQDVRAFGLAATELQLRVKKLLKDGNFADAEKLAAEGVERFPRFLDLWIDAGFVAVGLGDLDQAERRFRNAVELSPGDAAARLNLANVLLQQRRATEAEAEYREVLAAAPTDPFALYNLGALLAERNREPEAAVYWRRFADLYANHPRAGAVRAELERWGSPEGAD